MTTTMIAPQKAVSPPVTVAPTAALDVDALMRRLSANANLPSFPTVAIEILQLMRRDDAAVDDLVDLIRKDPALASKLLKTVNSPLFRANKQVTSIKPAVVALGLRTVKVMVLSFSLVDALKAKEDSGFDFDAYWQRSITTATTAQLLARRVAPAIADEAFVAGLLADVGIITMWRCARDVYEPIIQLARDTRQPFEVVERSILGVTHATISRKLLESWNLPPTLCEAVGSHHDDGATDANLAKLDEVVRSAALVAGLFCGDIPATQLGEVRSACMRRTGVQEQDLEELLQKVGAQVKEAAELLSLKSAPAVDYESLQAEAASRLADLTMQSEMERAADAQRAAAAQQEVNRLYDEKRALLEFASTDGLTKIANRAAFDQRLLDELTRAVAQRQAISLLLLDVDHFKRFNDTYGHQVGDAVLYQVARSLSATVQPPSFVARYGGEEFAVILTDKAAEVPAELAELIRQAIQAQTLPAGNQVLSVTVSVGGVRAVPASQPVTPELLVQRADQEMYRAKHAGRNCVRIAS